MKKLTIVGMLSAILLGLLPTGAQAGTHQRAGRRIDAVHTHLRVHDRSRHVRRILPPTQRHKHKHHHRKHEPNYAWQMFHATNQSRLRLGLPRYQLNRLKSKIATDHCLAMAHQHRLFHTSDVSPYLQGVGRWSGWAENIGWTTGGVDDLEKAFMGSPDHRPHILSTLYRYVAVGAVRIDGKLWVSLFFYG